MGQDPSTHLSTRENESRTHASDTEATTRSFSTGDTSRRIDHSQLSPVNPSHVTNLTVQPPPEFSDEPFEAPVKRPAPTPPSRQAEDALLADAGRIFEQLRIRLAELDHREQSLHEQSLELDQRQARFTRWIEQTKQDLTAREQRLQEQEIASESRQSELEQLAASTEEQRDRIQKEAAELQLKKAEQEERLKQEEAEIETLRQTRLDEIARLQQESETALEQKRQEFEEQCQSQLEEIKQDQAQATRRLRLQEDHLERLRSQVEQQRTALREETQKTRQRLQHFAQINFLRNQQLQQARRLFEERLAAFRREEERFRKTSVAQQAGIETQLRELHQRQDEWEQIYQSQKQEQAVRTEQLDRQENRLLIHQEKLQKLRQEVQQIHGENLEIRLAIEELKVEQAVDKGQTPDLESLNACRDKLAEHFVAMRTQLEELEERLLAEEKELRLRVSEHQKYEADSRKWITEGITSWEEQRLMIERQRDQLQQQRAAWEADQHQLITERQEAEEVIQNLLNQLESAQDPSASAA